MHRQTRTFSWDLPTGGALRSRAIQPMAARPGRLLQASYRVPVPISLEARSRQARRQTSYGRPQTVSNHITPSMEAQPGAPSLCRVFPAGVGLTLHIILIRERSLRTVCCRIHSICILPVNGVFETTNGGASWTKVFSGEISNGSNFNAELMSVPGQAGNLFFTGGSQTVSSQPVTEGFYRSTNGGATWTAVPNVLEVNCFGFGAPAPGQSYPSIYIVGWVNNVYGVWESDNNAQSWTQIGTYPHGSLDAHQDHFGRSEHLWSSVRRLYRLRICLFAGCMPAHRSTPRHLLHRPLPRSRPTAARLGDRITNDNTLTLTGTAEANATVKVFDGATLLGSAVANGSGAWTYHHGDVVQRRLTA